MTAPAREVWERRTSAPSLVIDLVDRLLRDRRTAGPAPRVRGPVRYRIVAVESAGVRTAVDPPLAMVMVRNATGHDLWFGAVRRGDDPPTRFLPDPPPPVVPAAVVEIDAERYQRVETVVTLPRAATPLRFALEPGVAYEFPAATTVPGGTGPTLLRGTVRTPDGTGVPGVRVRVVPLPAGQPAPGPEYVTDATGSWVLPFDDAVATTATAGVTLTPPDGPDVSVTEVTITRGDTSALRQASLAGETRKASGAALPGVTITTDADAAATTTSDAQGRWELWLPVAQFPPSARRQPVTVVATPPQGAPQVVAAEIHPRATARVAPFVFA
jgi:hypothetical protein